MPISATVFSREDLLQRGVKSLANIQAVAPSIVINTVNRSTFINIRGVGIAQSAPTSSPGVAYYIDGQLIPHEQHISQSFYDIASIEVLRGPQGTLTGQNSTGGAIYVRTPEPVFDDYDFKVDQTIGNYDWLSDGGCGKLRFLGQRRAADRGHPRGPRQLHARTSVRARATPAKARSMRCAPTSRPQMAGRAPAREHSRRLLRLRQRQLRDQEAQ